MPGTRYLRIASAVGEPRIYWVAGCPQREHTPFFINAAQSTWRRIQKQPTTA